MQIINNGKAMRFVKNTTVMHITTESITEIIPIKFQLNYTDSYVSPHTTTAIKTKTKTKKK